MKIALLSEVIWQFYNQGRAQATNRSFDKEDILQYLKMSVAEISRKMYFEYKKNGDGEEFYFSSPMLNVKRFTLADANERGARRIDLSAWDLIRLPRDYHITNIYPVGDCTTDEDVKAVTLVTPGEENFYRKPKFNFFQFAVVKGRGIDAYHLPLCVKSLDVETTFVDTDIDISLDVCFNAANSVLGVMLGVPGFIAKNVDNAYSPQQQSLKHAIQKQPEA